MAQYCFQGLNFTNISERHIITKISLSNIDMLVFYFESSTFRFLFADAFFTCSATCRPSLRFDKSSSYCRGGCGGRRKRSAQIWNPARAREARTGSRQLVFESIDDSRETPVETSLPSSRTWDICLLGSLCIAMKPLSFAFDYLQPAARTVWIELQVGIKPLLIVWFIHWALAPHYVWFSFIYLRSDLPQAHTRVVFIVTQNNQIKVVVITIYSSVITRINQAAFM